MDLTPGSQGLQFMPLDIEPETLLLEQGKRDLVNWRYTRNVNINF